VIGVAHQEQRAALESLCAGALLQLDPAPGMFVYRVAHEGRKWIGLVCSVDPADLEGALADARTSAGGRPDAARTQDEASQAAHEFTSLGWQLEPVVVVCDLPGEIGDMLIGDTNERPAYHFMAVEGGTHSAWVIRDPAPYVAVLRHARPLRVLRGAHRVTAARRAGHHVLAIVTRDLDMEADLAPLLAPRAGLFVAPVHHPGRSG
jgi:uncharacterized protein (DUF1015 family)